MNEMAPTEGIEKQPVSANKLPHPIWSEEELHAVEITHKQPEGFTDWVCSRSFLH